jgi:hypothetical protein
MNKPRRRLLQWSLAFALAAPTAVAAPGCGGTGTGTGAGAGMSPPAGGSHSALDACVDTKPLFANAICVCTDFRQSGHLVTHAPAGGSASIGVNGLSTVATGSRVEGSWTSGDTFTVAGEVAVAGDVTTRRDLDGSGVLHVGGSATVGGEVKITGDLQVAGGVTHASAFAVSDPCDCNPATQFDVAGAVAVARTANDNAAHQLTAATFAAGAPATLTLDGGRYYFDHVASIGSTQILAKGNVSLYIDGELDLVGDQQLALAPGATLDVYVNGNVGQSGVVALGGNPPSSFRLFVGGARAVLAASGEQTWSGLVYAPSAWVTVSGRTNVSGAIFAGRFDHSGDLDLWYGAAGNECAPPPPTTPPPTPPSGPIS